MNMMPTRPEEKKDIKEEIKAVARQLLYETEGHQAFDQKTKETLVAMLISFADWALETYAMDYILQNLEERLKGEKEK